MGFRKAILGFYNKKLIRRWDSERELRRKIGYFAPTRSLWSKISGTRGCPPPIIFAQL